MFHNHFASLLKAQGFGITPTKDRWEITGLPKEIIKAFSRRTSEIEVMALEGDITNPKEKANLAARSRKSKKTIASPEKVLEDWHARYDHMGGFPLDQLKQMRAPKPPSIKQIVSHTLDHVFERQSTVSTKKVLRTALQYGVGHISKDAIIDELHKRGAIFHHINDKERITLHHILKQEQHLIRLVKKGRGTQKKLVENPTLENIAYLNPSQRNAIIHILSSTDQVMALTGIAGAGKTTATGIIKQQIEQTGKQLIAVASSSDASRGTLRKEGFEGANTIAQLLQNETLQKALKHNVLLIDEASMLG